MKDGPVIGMLTPLVGGVYFGGLVSGVTGAAVRAGGTSLVLQAFDGGVQFTDFAASPGPAPRVGWDQADGFVVVLDALPVGELEALIATGRPVVLLSNDPDAPPCASVAPDNETGMGSAVDHLVEHGHTAIGFVGCLRQPDMRERYTGYLAAMERHGLVPAPASLFEVPDNLVTGGEVAGAALADAALPCTAVVAATDFNALGLVRVLAERGYDVPRDLAVVSFDDNPAARFAEPRLTSVRLRFEDLGEAAAELVLQQIEGVPVPREPHRVPTTLVVRESCGCGADAAALDAADVRGMSQAHRAELQSVVTDADHFRSLFDAQFEISLSLLSEAAADATDLGWIVRTGASAGLLALWTDDRSSLSIAGSYGLTAPPSHVERVREFPPRGLLEKAREQRQATFVIPVRDASTDWGWLAAVAPVETKLTTGREQLNQGVALLVAALRAAQDRRLVTELGRDLTSILESSPDAIARYDDQLRYSYVNREALRRLGAREEDLIGRTDAELTRDPHVARLWVEALQEVASTRREGQLDFREHDAGEPRWFQAHLVALLDDEGGFQGVLSSSRDITALKVAEESLTHLATHDHLTGLPNRALLADRLTRAVAKLERTRGRVALLFVDLDRFKAVNDTLGHEVGDRLLREVAHRLQAMTREGDTIARFGGDEFVILYDPIDDDCDVDKIALRLEQRLSEPYLLGGRDVRVGASVGVELVSDHRTDSALVLRRADAAMYEAKASKRGRRPRAHDTAEGAVRRSTDG